MQIAVDTRRQSDLGGQPRFGLTTAIELFLDPLIAELCLIANAMVFDQGLESRHIILALITLSMAFPGSLRVTDSRGRMARRTTLEWATIVLMLLLLGHFTGFLSGFSLAFVVGWALTTEACLLVAHELVRRALPRLITQVYQRTAVIVGRNEIGIALAQKFTDDIYTGIRFLGFFDDHDSKHLHDSADQRTIGSIVELTDYVKRQHIDHIYVALPMSAEPHILSLLDDIKDTTASIYFVPDIFLIDLIQGYIDSVGGIPVIAVCETPFTGARGLVKRTADVVLATLILLLVSPLVLAVALGVRLTSPGPVIFSQRRYGLDGREIFVYKFRSMCVTEDGNHCYAQVVPGDTRVTRFGTFIRKTSLDELPQFFNVLQGRMSIVGPRPHAIAVNEQYRKLIPGYMVRHKVKPGITGWAQVNGFRGGDDLEHMKSRIKCDLEYLRNWSLRLDLLIILKTIVLVVKDSRAY